MRRKIEEKNIRKLTKTGGSTLYVTIPAEIVNELKLRSKQKVVVVRRGSSIVIKDWKK